MEVSRRRRGSGGPLPIFTRNVQKKIIKYDIHYMHFILYTKLIFSIKDGGEEVAGLIAACCLHKIL